MLINRLTFIASLTSYTTYPKLPHRLGDGRALAGMWAQPGRPPISPLARHEHDVRGILGTLRPKLIVLGPRDAGLIYIGGRVAMNRFEQACWLPTDARDADDGIPLAEIYDWPAQAGLAAFVIDAVGDAEVDFFGGLPQHDRRALLGVVHPDGAGLVQALAASRAAGHVGLEAVMHDAAGRCVAGTRSVVRCPSKHGCYPFFAADFMPRGPSSG